MSYEALAEVYDILAYDIPAEAWSEYLLSMWGGPCARILEYGCGTGRITEHLLRAGHSVVAVDCSSAMLTQAARKLRPLGGSLALVEADMTEFVMEHPADLAICACDGVNYLTSDAELTRFFQRTAANLGERGLFMFDISSRYKLETVLGNEFYYDDGETETLFWQNSYEEKTRLLTMDLTLFRHVGVGYVRSDEQHVQRAWSIREIEVALVSAGFADVCCYAFGTRAVPTEDAERLQFVAVKRRDRPVNSEPVEESYL